MSRNSKNDAVWNVEPDCAADERFPWDQHAQNTGSKSGDKWLEKGDQNLLRQGSDDGEKPAVDHGDWLEVGITDWADNAPRVGRNWKTGALPHVGGDSTPRFGPSGDFGTGSPKAAEPTGQYAKKGGKSQRSGA